MCDIVSLFINTIVLNLLTVLVREDFCDYLCYVWKYILSYAVKLVHIAEYSVFEYKADFLFTVYREELKECKLIYK